jgi:hypothetical protein
LARYGNEYCTIHGRLLVSFGRWIESDQFVVDLARVPDVIRARFATNQKSSAPATEGVPSHRKSPKRP